MPYAGRIAKLLSDTYPPVAITAAAVLYEVNQDDRSKECLIRYMLDENDYWALMSVNYALYSDHKEAFIASVRACRLVEDRNYKVNTTCMDFLGSLIKIGRGESGERVGK